MFDTRTNYYSSTTTTILLFVVVFVNNNNCWCSATDNVVNGNNQGLDVVAFDVFSPDELKIVVPNYPRLRLVTFRIGVRRNGAPLEDLEHGENRIRNNEIFISDSKLNLQRGNIINYLLVFKDDVAYKSKSGKYVFDGGG